MADKGFKSSVETLLNGMNGFLSSKTVVGEPIVLGETIILPLVDVSFGFGAGCSDEDKKSGGAGGMGGKISPSAILVISEGHTKLVNVKGQDSITKILDLVPELVDRFSPGRKNMMSDDDVRQAVKDAEDK